MPTNKPDSQLEQAQLERRRAARAKRRCVRAEARRLADEPERLQIEWNRIWCQFRNVEHDLLKLLEPPVGADLVAKESSLFAELHPALAQL